MKNATRQGILGCMANFGWNFAQHFFVETPYGNFIWSDPDYGGDNRFVYTKFTLQQWLGDPRLYVRDKGIHMVSRYCGEEIKIIIDGKEIV